MDELYQWHYQLVDDDAMLVLANKNLETRNRGLWKRHGEEVLHHLALVHAFSSTYDMVPREQTWLENDHAQQQVL